MNSCSVNVGTYILENGENKKWKQSIECQRFFLLVIVISNFIVYNLFRRKSKYAIYLQLNVRMSVVKRKQTRGEEGRKSEDSRLWSYLGLVLVCQIEAPPSASICLRQHCHLQENKYQKSSLDLDGPVFHTIIFAFPTQLGLVSK